MRRARFIPLALLLCLAARGAVSARAGGDYGISFLVPGASGYNHGPSYVTRLGSALLVGSPGEGTGAVDVYDLKSGARRLHLTPVAPGYGVGFGVGVTASARGFLVGDLEANEAYEFKRRTGELLRTFRPPPDTLARWFGAAIADLGTLIAIGDPAAVAEPSGAEPQGRLHLYDARDGALLHTLLDPVAKRQSTFGASVVRVAGGFAVGQPSGYYDPGSVYVYDRHGVLVQTLRAPAPARNDRFGAALAASGGRLVVGAPGGGIFEAPVDGRVYVFERRGRRFVPASTLEAPAELTAGFGGAVAIEGSRAVVGSASGAALFAFGRGTPLAVLTGPPVDYDLYNDTFYQPWYGFGASVVLVGKTIVVASAGDDENSGALVAGFTRNAVPPAACHDQYLCP